MKHCWQSLSREDYLEGILTHLSPHVSGGERQGYTGKYKETVYKRIPDKTKPGHMIQNIKTVKDNRTRPLVGNCIGLFGWTINSGQHRLNTSSDWLDNK